MSATDGTEPAVSKHSNWLKASAMLATMIQVLDMTIANVALPHMQAALGANQDSISWVLSSYIVASAIAIPATGWLAGRIGRRPLFLLSIAGFTISSMLCGLAANLDSMVLFRILQGLSGAFLAPLGQTVMLDSTPPEKRGQAMAIYGMGVMIGPIMGPVIGGWLTENMDWRWVFFVNLPLGILAFLGLFMFLPDAKRETRPLDIFGLVTLGIGLAALQLMLDRGQHVDWFNSLEIWLETGIAISAFWIFAVHSLTGRNPLYPLALLRDRNLLIGILLMFMVGFVLTSAMALIPLMLQSLMHYPVLDAGMLVAVRGIGVMAMMAVTGRVIAHVDVRMWLAGSLAVIFVSFWGMTGWTLETTWSHMALNGFLQGVGIGMIFVPTTMVAFASIPPELQTDASGIISLARSVGSSAGISLVITMLARNSAASHEDLIAHVTPYTLWLDPGFFALPVDAIKGGLASIEAEVTRQALMIAFLDDYHMMMIMVLCMIPLVFLIRPPRNTHASETAVFIE